MSKTSLILIAALLVVLAIFINVTNTKFDTVLPSSSKQKTNAVTLSGTTLSLSPQVTKAQAGQTITVDVHITTQSEKPTLMQLEMGYDANKITAVDIQPGNYFKSPEVLLHKINPRTGRISYALEETSEEMSLGAKGVIATITFMPMPLALQSETALKILPKTIIKRGNDLLLLNEVFGTKIIIPSSSIPQASEAAVVSN